MKSRLIVCQEERRGCDLASDQVRGGVTDGVGCWESEITCGFL